MSTPESMVIDQSDAISTITSIPDGRARIDEIDAVLRDLIAARRRISARIQELRMSDGGPRVENGREHEILAAWSTELGSGGAEVAQALLALCRGPVPRS